MAIEKTKAVASFMERTLRGRRSLREDVQGIDQPDASELARQIVTDLGRGSNTPFYGMSITKLGDTAALEANFGVKESDDDENLVPFKVEVEESDVTFYVNGEEVASCGRGLNGYPEALQQTMDALSAAKMETTDSAEHEGNPGYGDYEAVDNEFSDANTEEE